LESGEAPLPNACDNGLFHGLPNVTAQTRSGAQPHGVVCGGLFGLFSFFFGYSPYGLCDLFQKGGALLCDAPQQWRMGILPSFNRRILSISSL
jgi:hypothetical protein